MQPELRRFALADTESKQLLVPFPVDPQRQVHRAGLDVAVGRSRSRSGRGARPQGAGSSPTRAMVRPPGIGCTRALGVPRSQKAGPPCAHLVPPASRVRPPGAHLVPPATKVRLPGAPHGQPAQKVKISRATLRPIEQNGDLTRASSKIGEPPSTIPPCRPGSLPHVNGSSIADRAVDHDSADDRLLLGFRHRSRTPAPVADWFCRALVFSAQVRRP
jgi:hypothetical protein